SEEHTSELQSREKLVCRLLLEKKKDRLVGYLGNNVDRKMIKEAMHQINKGECSYSAYMGNSLEGRMDVRQKKVTGADDAITRMGWIACVEYMKALAADKRQGASSLPSKPIIIDFGASQHMISDRSLISDVKAISVCVMRAPRGCTLFPYTTLFR